MTKICAECKHFYRISGIAPMGAYYCKRVKNLVTGGDTPCYQVRCNDELCGIDGRYFEKKEKHEACKKKKSLIDILLRRTEHDQ